ncbi:TetR/AcrR family transcriptional regulator [Pseudonocardia sp. CA-107938]|uniref:TetR/AcrR family transcriptional regulator n=1 Tax=Pseudonocardia sp. CA-107938 TaxID=3240021 RepID=UPI003D8A12F1
MSTEPGGELRRSLDLMWQGVPEPARGPRHSLSLERIVRAAVAVADAEGLAALSMRRIAAELDAGAMSLYRYVPGKTNLIDLMVDEVYGEDLDELAAVEGDWRARITRSAQLQWATYLRHPWMLQIPQGRPLLGPNSMRATEIALGQVDGLGLDEHEMTGVVIAVNSFVAGLARSTVENLQAAEQTGLSDEDWWSVHSEVFATALPPGTMPMLERLGEAGVWSGDFDSFGFGLERLLDGIAVLVAERQA